VKFLKYFSSYALLKIGRFLLNSNKRFESENKDGTSSKSVKCQVLKIGRFLLNSNKRFESENKDGTSSKSVKSLKKRKHRKYDDSYLDFGFTSTEVDGEERPQGVLCMKVLASECMIRIKLKRHLETTHPSIISKSCDYFSRKLKELIQQKGSFYKQASIPSNALLAYFKVAHRIGKCMKPHTIAEELILPAALDMVNIMIGESAGKLLSKVPLSNNTIRSRMQHIAEDLNDQLIGKWGWLCPV
jgi:hypothetical protein